MSEIIYGDRRVYWVWLEMVFGVANESFWNKAKGYRQVHELCMDIKSGRAEGLTAGQQKRANEKTLEQAKEIIDSCEQQGITVLTLRSEGYPTRLKHTLNPPPVLFVRGSTRVFDAPVVVAVAGSRRACDYSLEVTNEICTQLANAGALVISGFEEGIDTYANSAALNAGAETAAVCGRGICDELSKGELSDAIAKNGAMIAEYTDSEDFGKVKYDCRNRIMCALADCVLFIECAADGHSLNNVRHAQQLGRPIFAVPPADITDRRFFGQRNLIRNGAQPVFDAGDILRVLKPGSVSQSVGVVNYDDVKVKKEEKIGSNNKIRAKKIKKFQKNEQEDLHKSKMSVTIDMSALNPIQQKIYTALKENDTLHLNQLAERLEMSVNDVLSELMLMQISGSVEEISGKQYRLK